MVDTWVRGAKSGFEAGAASRQDEVSKLQIEINLLEKEIIETQEFLNNQNCIKQAEIDGLNALGEMSEQKIDDLVLRNIELQKRIGDVLNTIEPSEEISHMLYRKVYKILKGDRNE